jgi:hypothetical protein
MSSEYFTEAIRSPIDRLMSYQVICAAPSGGGCLLVSTICWEFAQPIRWWLAMFWLFMQRVSFRAALKAAGPLSLLASHTAIWRSQYPAWGKYSSS